jgi:hypothetical protein
VPIERHAWWRRPDGRLFDPRMRVQERLGAAVLKPEPLSLRIRGTTEGESWTGMTFPDSGDYWFPGGLATVHIDREHGRGATGSRTSVCATRCDDTTGRCRTVVRAHGKDARRFSFGLIGAFLIPLDLLEQALDAEHQGDPILMLADQECRRSPCGREPVRPHITNYGDRIRLTSAAITHSGRFGPPGPLSESLAAWPVIRARTSIVGATSTELDGWHQRVLAADDSQGTSARC